MIRIFVLLFALYSPYGFLLGSDYSEYCFNNPSKCDDTELCDYATLINNQTIVWSTDSWKKDHVQEAKKRGLVCSVGDRICSSQYPEKCADDIVCLNAAKKSGNGYIWKNENLNSVKEAKKRRLTCGTGNPEEYITEDDRLSN